MRPTIWRIFFYIFYDMWQGLSISVIGIWNFTKLFFHRYLYLVFIKLSCIFSLHATILTQRLIIFLTISQKYNKQNIYQYMWNIITQIFSLTLVTYSEPFNKCISLKFYEKSIYIFFKPLIIFRYLLNVAHILICVFPGNSLLLV